MVSSVGSGSLTVEVVMAVSVQSRASCSGILVNSDFTSKYTSLWSSGICAVLIASIKFSVDCSLCLDWSVKGCSTVVKYLDSWYVGDPQNETIISPNTRNAYRFLSHPCRTNIKGFTILFEGPKVWNTLPSSLTSSSSSFPSFKRKLTEFLMTR